MLFSVGRYCNKAIKSWLGFQFRLEPNGDELILIEPWLINYLFQLSCPERLSSERTSIIDFVAWFKWFDRFNHRTSFSYADWWNNLAFVNNSNMYINLNCRNLDLCWLNTIVSAKLKHLNMKCISKLKHLPAAEKLLLSGSFVFNCSVMGKISSWKA